ncbi:PREDICTED: uncharacterized protein LOC106121111 [Papilio xuthus]|uniref:Uncharacterized protein LOC106121111 n=1 Tax=Papilio xuthus TaxID=66420 RepID=A0A194PVA3_PAPXU|nr:PREDICTED: uncharacterized protein LOC106121111 [Papilio xuthus]KPI97252.1 hypothetical protein RR46_09159 [Papilio xuthus]
MSHSKNAHKLSEIESIETFRKGRQEDEGEIIDSNAENCIYAVTVSKKSSFTDEDPTLDFAQKSFISIHSTDQLCQIPSARSQCSLEECNVEVISLNEVFPSTSEESFSNDDDLPTKRDQKYSRTKQPISKIHKDNSRSSYVPTNSKSTTGPGRLKDGMDAPVRSDFDIPKNTLHVVGSNPGEPKMTYPDPPKKMSKTMKKLLRNIDKHKVEQNSKSNEKAISKLTTMRGILKDNRCDLECTGDSTAHDSDDYNAAGETLSLDMDLDSQTNYTKHSPDKNVSFNTQVVIIHFTGDLCVGQSIETLSKEKDQQARNSELKKTFLTKYNEFWPTQK